MFLESAIKKNIIRLLQKKTNSMRFIGSQLNSLLQFEEGINSAIQDFEAERPTKYLQNLGDYFMIGYISALQVCGHSQILVNS